MRNSCYTAPLEHYGTNRSPNFNSLSGLDGMRPEREEAVQRWIDDNHRRLARQKK